MLAADGWQVFTFQSTPPRREVTFDVVGDWWAVPISIHTSPKGGDSFPLSAPRDRDISIHTSPKGGDTGLQTSLSITKNFNPHLPEGR